MMDPRVPPDPSLTKALVAREARGPEPSYVVHRIPGGVLQPSGRSSSVRWAVSAAFAVTVVLTTALGTLSAAPAQASACSTRPAALGTPSSGVAGYSGQQLENAAAVMRAGGTLGLGIDAQTIAVMTAMGESSLRNLPYGDDAINPDGSVADSVGLFQQQHMWGSLADRMTPATAALAFYRHLLAVPGWQALTPTAAAHAVQGNLDPAFYSRFHSAAMAVVAALTPAVRAGAIGCVSPTPPVAAAAPGSAAGATAPVAPTTLGDTTKAIGDGLIAGLTDVGGTLADSGG